MSKLREIFCACYLWSRLSLSLVTLQYVVLFRFLRMTSCFHMMMPVEQNQIRHCFVKLFGGNTSQMSDDVTFGRIRVA